MAEQNWTTPQYNAIYARGGSLLVSAAAGSGKTAVLVERLVSLICDKENPVDLSRLLVVTFSNAAAAEMRQRVGSRLSQLIVENPKNLYLQKQQAMLGSAQISTIHSFCLELIRQNFQNLSISPDFSVIDSAELSLLESDCLELCVEEYYEQDQNGDFFALVEMLSTNRDDQKLLQTVKKIYGFARSHPFYKKWLSSKLALYNPEIPVTQTIWGEALLNYAQQTLRFCQNTLEEAIVWIVGGDEKVEKAYAPAFQSDLNQVKKSLLSAENNDWDDLVSSLQNFNFMRLGALRGEDSLKDKIKSARDRVKKIIKQLAEQQFNASKQDFMEDMLALYPNIDLLFSLVCHYGDTLDEVKRARKKLDFSDLEHLTLELLVELDENENYQITPQAMELSQQFDSILVDEYQDTNEVQDLIFSSISQDGQNLFMVGDVKQSIYSFRMAMPQIFLSKKQNFFPYDSIHFPASISLDTNFRSRSQVTQGVNYLFEMMMSPQMGEIDYNQEESLKFGASYPQHPDCQPELLLLDAQNSEIDSLELEAGEIASKISDMLKTGYLVTDHGELRPSQPKDFCILLRSPNNRAVIYVKKLEELGISAWSNNNGGFLHSREISVVVSFLRILDNPLLDIELASVLLSPMFSFCDDELAEIRLENKTSSLFQALSSFGEHNGKSKEFLEVFYQLRQFAAYHSIEDLVLKIYELTSLLDISLAMPLGKERHANLLLLVEYASHYQSQGYKSLGSFVGLLDRLYYRGSDLDSANGISDLSNAVQVISVHRSKGLEFPVVFLADTAHMFNKRDLYEPTLLHSYFGFACVRRNFQNHTQFSTVPMSAIRLGLEKSMLSEEMRVLYVALTRAKEKLIVVNTQKKDISKKLAGLYHPLQNNKLSPVVVADGNSTGDWILMCLLHHPSAGNLLEMAQVDGTIKPDQNPWKITIKKTDSADTLPQVKTVSSNCFEVDEKLLQQWEQQDNWHYSYQSQTLLPTKLAVSDIVEKSNNTDYHFQRRPRFLTEFSLTSAEKGQALHKFMQFADYHNAKENLENEIERMQKNKFLSSQEIQSLNHKKLHDFFFSPLAQRIFDSPKVLRELRFMSEFGQEELQDILPGIDAQSKIVVQGVADCVFLENGKAVLVDYKTDYVQSLEELANRYHKQLELYRTILQKSLNTTIDQTLLYSFSLSNWIDCAHFTNEKK